MSLSRRQLLGGLAVGLGGAAVGAGAGAAAGAAVGRGNDAAAPVPPEPLGQSMVPFFGVHQAGIETPAQAFAAFAALDLLPGATIESTGRLMRLLSDDAARLTQGRAALADPEAEMAAVPARLTITFGFGPGFFDVLGLGSQRPDGLVEIPPMKIDDLQPRWSGGDLLIQVCADDPVTLSHALRMLWKDSRAFARQRWLQQGFLDAAAMRAAGTTPRNLMGQVDGTVNPRTPEQFDDVVWSDGPPAWLAGGTMLVVRRIAMDMEGWDAVDRPDRENVIGRRLADGAPLTGSAEFDPVDLEAEDAAGLPVISDFAHIRRANTGGGAPFLRRGYNYDLGARADGTTDAGHIFTAYTNDIEGRFVPVQRTLAELDLLNQWTTPIGSAVFALPPGAEPGGWVGETLLG